MRDRGAADALGLVLIAPAVMGLALLIIALGRGVDAKAEVRSAAESAAQAAALERNPESADAAAQRAADAILGDSTNCNRPHVDVRFMAPTGTSGVRVDMVEVTITCEVSNRGVEVINQPYTETVSAVATIDHFRARR